MNFLCSSLRPIIDGKIKPDPLRLLLDAEIERRETDNYGPVNVLTKVGDSMPGFGIVAAVMGIVITMASINGPIEQIGTNVAAALVGTFLGILARLRLRESAGYEPGIQRQRGTGFHALHRLMRHRLCQRHGARDGSRGRPGLSAELRP